MAYLPKADKKTSLQIKVQNTNLQKELKALALAEESNARSQQFKESQFRTKYEKYLTTGNFESSLSKNDSFKMATKDTSAPAQQTKEQVPLHKLLYTNGEIDEEKVVCVHLISVQYSKAQTKTNDKTLRIFPKRSNPSILESSALPFYILEIDHKIYMESRTSFPQGQDVIIIVNNGLEKLVTSIVEVLAIVSPQKLKKIKDVLLNKRSIQEIMIKTKILNFLAQLKERPIVLNTDNYRMEIAQFQEEPTLEPNILTVSRVMVKDKSRKIEQIQKEIIKTINEYSEKDVCAEESWSMLHRKYCNCKKEGSHSSLISGKAIALLKEDGTEFARVTGSGCRLPSRPSTLTTSVTAIIKSSPREKRPSVPDQGSGFPLNSSVSSSIKNQESRLIHSMLYKVKNSHRILIGKKAAELRSQHSFSEKPGKQKLPLNKIIQEVFSRDSLLSFASSAENEELKLMFQPCCKGGLGMGSFLLKSKSSKDNKKENSKLSAISYPLEDEAIPQIIKQEQCVMKTAKIKQEIFVSETKTKMKKFLQTDNPGESTSNSS